MTDLDSDVLDADQLADAGHHVGGFAPGASRPWVHDQLHFAVASNHWVQDGGFVVPRHKEERFECLHCTFFLQYCGPSQLPPREVVKGHAVGDVAGLQADYERLLYLVFGLLDRISHRLRLPHAQSNDALQQSHRSLSADLLTQELISAI